MRLISKKFFRWLHNGEFAKGIKIGTVEGDVGADGKFTPEELDSLRVIARGSIRN